MPNSYFQFKQFRIDQGQCAMKVTTEGCVLGAWVAANTGNPRHVLDIGTGTGLLALMLAQAHPSAKIDAVEMDAAAYEQAAANFEASPWADRLSAKKQRIQDFKLRAAYDLIVCNPPFFHQSLRAESAQANHARHSDTLHQTDLLRVIEWCLAPQGQACVLYPEREMRHFMEAATAQGWHLDGRLSVFNHADSPVFREIVCLSRQYQEEAHDTLVIKDASGAYTTGFIELLQPYYWHL